MNADTLSQFVLTLGRVSAQAAVLVLLVVLLQFIFRRQLAPRWRCALWLLVMVRLALPISVETTASLFNWLPQLTATRVTSPAQPEEKRKTAIPPSAANSGEKLATLDEAVPQPSMPREVVLKREAPIVRADAPVGHSRTIPSPPAPPPSRSGIDWLATAFILWFLGAVALGSWVIANSLRLARQTRALPRVTDPAILSLLEECRQRMGVRQHLQLVEGASLPGPALQGAWHPRLILPKGFIQAFSAADLHFVFLHELAHLKRRDVWLNWIVAGLQIIHWFNPLVWLAFARWRGDRELACDALALETAGAGQNLEYGRTILRLLDRFAGRVAAPGWVGILEDKRQLQQRIGMIASFVPARRWPAHAGLLMAVLTVTGLTNGKAPKLSDKAPRPTTANTIAAAAAVPETLPSPKTTATPKIEAQEAKEEILTRFTVLDAESGAPLPGVKLSVSYFFTGSRMEGRDFTTDRNGFAVIPDYEGGSQRGINMFVTPEGYVPKTISWQVREEIPAAYAMRMAPATRIAGVVQDESGRIVPGVKVNLSRPGMRDRTVREYVDFHPRATAVTTDAEGRWSFHYVPPELQNIVVLMSHPDFAPSQQNVPVQRPESTNAVLVIQRGVTIEGRVSGPDGTPISGIKVKEIHNYAWPVKSTETGNDGRYTLRGIRPGEIKLIVQNDTFAPQMKTLQETGDTVRADFQLTPGQKFHGRIVDKNGRPIAGAVAQTDWDGQGLRKVSWKTTTDAAGHFAWNAAPNEPLLFWFEAEGFEWNRGVLLRPGDTDHEIVLKEKSGPKVPRKVSGQVIDALSRQPVASFKVLIGALSDLEFPPEYERGVDGSAGAYHLEIKAPFAFSSYVILVEGEGYRPAKSPVQTTVKEGDVVLNFELHKGSGPAGIIRLADGRPASDAAVYFSTLKQGVYMDKPGEAREGTTSASLARTDAQGRFSFPPEPDPHSLIVLREEGFAEVKIETLEQSTNIVLSSWGRVEGQLMIGSKPAPDETIMLHSVSYKYSDGVRPFAALSFWFETQTDADGKFTMDKLPPGERKVGHRLSFRKGRPGPIPETHGVAINVKPGETTRITLGGTGRAVTGRVVVTGSEEKIDWLDDVHQLDLQLPDPSAKPHPQRHDFANEDSFLAAHKQYYADRKAFWTSPDGRTLERRQRRYVPIFKSDGSFQIDDVPAGTYQLTIKPSRNDEGSMGPTRSIGQGKPIGTLTNVFTIPDMPGGRDDEPFDLGTLTLRVVKTL